MEEAELTYKPPRQRRSRESLERILDAAEELIRERGFDAMTIAEVVERSKSSVGSIYARFPNKLGLLRAVHSRYLARVQDEVFAALDRADAESEGLEDLVERVVRVVASHLLSEQQLFRAFIVEAVFDSKVRAQGERTNAARRSKVMEVLLRHRDEIRHPEPELATRWFYSFCMALLRERITFGEAAELAGGFADEALIRELTRTGLAYLTGKIPDSVERQGS